MTILDRMLLTGGLLLCGLGWPRVSYAISGCSNGTLAGTYNAQVETINLASAISAPGTGTVSNAVPASLTGGLSGTNTSLAGNVAGLGRFVFDGGGNIVGANVSTSGVVLSGNAALGTYNVNPDCSMTMALASGQTFDGVIVSSGASANGLSNPNGTLNEILFVETDTAGAGVSGTFSRAPNTCLAATAQSFGFQFQGVTATPASTSGTGTVVLSVAGSAAPGSSSGPSFATNSGIGVLRVDGQGGFALSETSAAGGSVQRVTSSGTYTLGTNCAIQLTFTPGVATVNGTANSSFVPAVNFTGLLSTTAGVLSVEPGQGTNLTGSLIPQ